MKVEVTMKDGSVKMMSPRDARAMEFIGRGKYMTRQMVAEDDGEKWDPEIHVASKAKNKDGSYRKKPTKEKA